MGGVWLGEKMPVVIALNVNEVIKSRFLREWEIQIQGEDKRHEENSNPYWNIGSSG